MSPNDEHWRRVREAFDRTVGLAPERRSELLDAEPPAVKSEVERLLAIDAQASEVLERKTGRALADATWTAALAPGQRIGPHRLIRALGSGGMGVVFEAEESNPRRRVALKTVRAEFFTSDLLQRFTNEVGMLARLEHPGIARIYSTGTFTRDGRECPYYTMELVEDARTILGHAERAGLDERGRIALFLQACDAVEHGHKKGVIHRDLKPGNLLVDAAGRLKVIDLGLARPDDPAAFGGAPLHTQAGLVFGTLPYMSPEHVSGRPHEIDTQSDVFSLGCILCELLTGRPPHDLYDMPVRAALERIERDEPQLPDELDRELRWVVSRAVARERGRRYASVGELAADLRRYLAREPVHAAPPSRVYALRTFARRHRGLLAATAAVMLALAVGLGRARSEARAARTARANAERAASDAERAADAADRARSAAELEASVSNEVSLFLASLFTGMHAFSDGADARVSDVLDLAVTRLDQVSRETSRAILTGLVGQGHLNLGDLAAAEPFLADAVALGAALPPDSVHRLRNEILWADWLEQSGHYAESRQMSLDVLTRGADVLEPTDRYYVRYNLAICDSRLGRHREAEATFRELLEHELAAKESWTRVINLTHRVAAELGHQGRADAARDAYENALERCDQMPGNELYAATIRMDLAQLLHLEFDELDEAARLLDLAGAAFERHDAPPSSRALCELNRARLRIDLGELDGAADALAEAMWQADRSPATTRVDVYVEMTAALLADAQGDRGLAREAGARALALAEELAGPEGLLASEVRDVLQEIATSDD